MEAQVRKAVVISKPKPHYPKAARKQHVEVTVVLRAVFRSTGEVTDVKFDKAVPDNIREDLVKQFADECIKAAHKIKFEPAVKNGHPVSMYMQLEYYFSGR